MSGFNLFQTEPFDLFLSPCQSYPKAGQSTHIYQGVCNTSVFQNVRNIVHYRTFLCLGPKGTAFGFSCKRS